MAKSQLREVKKQLKRAKVDEDDEYSKKILELNKQYRQ